ncbi:MAG: LD-carboxypeptidase [Parasporobacterium sp.]|nr:LD-carboxypeptidase [Parasporobacterium sp.]
MIFPESLKKGDTIGVTAMSHPADKDTDKIRFRNGAAQLKKKGYNVIFTPNVFNDADRFGRSSSGRERAAQFNALCADPSVKGIYSAGGGDFLAEMLRYVDTETFLKNPKWIQGYSDNTSILFYLTTKCDVATAYGANFGDFGMEPWHLSVSRGLEVLEGKCKIQDSFDKYQDGFGKRETGLEGYTADIPVNWKCITSADGKCEFTGRLIGGCLDVLLNIAGTPYDGACEFIEKYKDDGIIWYMESFALQFENMMEGLWKLKEMGWFRYTKGIIFGRQLFYNNEAYDGTPLPSYEDVLKERLSELKVPVITGADIGHRGPQFVTVNGAMARVSCEDGSGSMEYI